MRGRKNNTSTRLRAMTGASRLPGLAQQPDEHEPGYGCIAPGNQVDLNLQAVIQPEPVQ